MFPRMLDQYQLQLTRMLEAEQYSEAKDLLRFLMNCQGEEKRHYDEWGSLLTWLDMAFPAQGEDPSAFGSLETVELKVDEDEESIRRNALAPEEYDDAYVQQVLYIMRNHPIPDQQVLALERAAHIQHPDVDEAIVTWLTGNELHPALQFKALQCLRRRGITGKLPLMRMGEQVELEIERTPLSMDDFPEPVSKVVERVESVTEVIDVTMPHFAREMWKECLQCFYGTSIYERLVYGEEDSVDCFAAALHLIVELSLYDKANDDDIRDTYGITQALRFQYEQACRSLRQVALLQDRDDGTES
ncbi:hypothetical protein [Paenibacillus nasutitermitis]|uniref:Uncharacterized protein n=1 Tax=Paenibacillus nasutitermitis TaxID=1652958 RepID=A0A916YPX9_9BACL|nr:hypothetical protein [Paenibacillus nasutitermitis]GGD54417.1 hypothetical protein GCM10010911_10010 [Paenibacillus nasutitermitis]